MHSTARSILSHGRLAVAAAVGILLLLAVFLTAHAVTSLAWADDQAQEGASPVVASVTDALNASVDQINAKVARVEATAAQEAQAPTKAQIRQTAVACAYNMIGVDYVAGGDSPEEGFDCSGLTSYVYAQAGIKLTHNAQAQYNQTPSVKGKLKVGDLVFFGGSTSSITHVGIYVGNGKYIHAPQSGEQVRVDKLSDRTNYVGATRPR